MFDPELASLRLNSIVKYYILAAIQTIFYCYLSTGILVDLKAAIQHKTLVKDSRNAIIPYMIRHKAIHFSFMLFLIWLFSCLHHQPCAFATGPNVIVEVEIKGIKGELRKNVLASLKINKYKDSPRLTPLLIKKYHVKATTEIKNALAPFGYFAPHIKSRLQSDEAGRRWKALYEIEPGTRVKIGRAHVVITGPGKKFLKNILQKIKFQTGEPFLQAKYEKAKKELVNSLYMLGFAKANLVRGSVKVYVHRGVADIDLIVHSGPRHFFGKVFFIQQKQALETKLLQGMLPFAEDEPYSPKKLLELQRRLESSGYFSDVLVEAELEKAEHNRVPVLVRLKPGRNRTFSFGVGYGTDTGLRGKAKIECHRCNRKGHRFEGELALAEREQHLSASYLIPLGHPELHSIAARAAASREESVDKVSNLVSAGLSYGKNIGNYQYTLFTELRGEDYRAGEDSHRSMLLMPGMRFSLIETDNRLRAYKGLKLDLEVSGATKGILSDTTFLRSMAYVKAIYPLIDRLRIISRLDLGATLTDDFNRLPASLRFYAGGTQSVRGYRYKSLSPKDDAGDLVGGRYLLAASLELEYALGDHFGLAFFFDAGNAMDTLSATLKQGAGAGLRWNLSFGQIRLDIASALSRKGNPLKIHFSIGTDL